MVRTAEAQQLQDSAYWPPMGHVWVSLGNKNVSWFHWDQSRTTAWSPTICMLSHT